MLTKNDASDQAVQAISSIVGTSLPLPDETNDEQQDMIDCPQTHAYQIPQQSNVGSECLFLTDSPVLSPNKANSARNDRTPVSCPFYVMYLTNLAMQQRQNKIDNNIKNNEKDAGPVRVPSMIRKVPVNSRTSTAYPKYQPIRRQLNSPLSINTYSTVDEDDCMTNSTPLANNKRLSAKMSSLENETANVLRDILRTSSWRHVKV